MPTTESADSAFLRTGAAALGLELTQEQVAALLRLRSLLLETNTQVNLTAIVDPMAVLSRHILDSLTCFLAVDPAQRQEPLRVLDVGSGAGFPALVLAIVCPGWQVFALEATAKKVHFQEQVIAELGLTNMHASHGRAEERAHDAAWRASFQIVTARALAALSILLEWCQPFATVGGCVIALKKGDLRDEIAAGSRAARLLGGATPDIHRLPPALTALAPDLDDGRVVIRIRQETLTPSAYPRLNARRAPLGNQ